LNVLRELAGKYFILSTQAYLLEMSTFLDAEGVKSLNMINLVTCSLVPAEALKSIPGFKKLVQKWRKYV
jgi:hypothetical protein